MMNFEKLMHKIYDRFYRGSTTRSEVSSSHWRYVGWHKASFNKNNWKLKGAGFGDWARDDVINNLRTFGVRKALEEMPKRYDCPLELWELGKEVARSHNRVFSFDCAKQVLSLSKVVGCIANTRKDFPFSSAGIKNVCVIGDGYGYLTTLLKACDPGLVVTSVNLGRGLLFDAYYTSLRFPAGIVGGRSENADFIFLPAEDYKELDNLPQDLVFNIASMQEMNIEVVNRYFSYLRRNDGGRVLFYCCNRAEKHLPDGEIIRFSEYGWSEADEIVFDEICPWYKSFPFGIFPKWLPFDGVHLHRLAYLAGNGS